MLAQDRHCIGHGAEHGCKPKAFCLKRTCECLGFQIARTQLGVGGFQFFDGRLLLFVQRFQLLIGPVLRKLQPSAK
jgi:hypothetical protein